MKSQSIKIIALTLFLLLQACDNKSSSSNLQLPPSGKNELLDATPENCAKVTDLMSDYKENIAAAKGVPVASVNFLRQENCMAVVDTAKGPQRCTIGGVLWYKTGEFDAMDAWVKNGEQLSNFGAFHCL